jgi:hypothetical protein
MIVGMIVGMIARKNLFNKRLGSVERNYADKKIALFRHNIEKSIVGFCYNCINEVLIFFSKIARNPFLQVVWVVDIYKKIVMIFGSVERNYADKKIALFRHNIEKSIVGFCYNCINEVLIFFSKIARNPFLQVV